MSLEKTVCWKCSTEIIEYYDQSYKGKRGKCPICGVDFPLEWSISIKNVKIVLGSNVIKGVVVIAIIPGLKPKILD